MSATFRDFSKEDLWEVIRVERQRRDGWRSKAEAEAGRARGLHKMVVELAASGSAMELVLLRMGLDEHGNPL